MSRHFLTDKKLLDRLRERLAFLFGNISLPLVVVGFFPTDEAATFFLTSISVQAAFQANYVFGIEYRQAALKAGSRQIGIENFFRILLPCALAGLLLLVREDAKSPLFAALFANALITEASANYRFFLSVTGQIDRAILQSILLGLTTILGAVMLGGSLELLIAAQGTMALGLLVAGRSQDAPFWSLPNRNDVLPLISKYDLRSCWIWLIGRGDRLLLPAIGIGLPREYVVMASLNDSAFQLVRQVAVIERIVTKQMHLALGAIAIGSVLAAPVIAGSPLFGWHWLAPLPGLSAFFVAVYLLKLKKPQ